MRIEFQGMPDWPHTATRNRSSRYAFKAGWEDTLKRLRYEIAKIADPTFPITISTGHRPVDIRKVDGLPRGDRQPLHPGIVVQFRDKPGRVLSFKCDQYQQWQHNVRAIALTLEALRAVNRWGAVQGGAQYAGFRELPASTTSQESMVAAGRKIVEDQFGGNLRRALRHSHPDVKGDEEDFKRVQAYADSTREAA